MNILWALALVTEVVGLVLNKATRASHDTNATQLIGFGEQPLSTDPIFSISIALRKNLYISEVTLSESILLSFQGLCLIPYRQYIGTRDYSPAGRHDLIIKVTEAPSSPVDLAAKYTMVALYLCFANLILFPQPRSLTFYSAQCPFGLGDSGSSEITTLIGKVDFLPGPVQGSATYFSGSSLSVPDIGGVGRIKQRANAAAAALAGASSRKPDQGSSSAALNTLGGQEPSPLRNQTSATHYSFKLRGDGAIIPPDQLLLSVLASLIDRASQPRDGQVSERTFTPKVGNYIVQSRAAPEIELTYPTIPECFVQLLRYLMREHLPIREGDWTCTGNFRDVLLGTFTKKPGANADIAAPSMGEPSGSVDITRRNDQ